MSIINTFDPISEEIIKAQDTIKEIENFPKTVMVVFSAKFRELFLKKYNAEEIGYLIAGGNKLPIYKFEYKGVQLGFFNTIIGGAGSAALLEELIACGAQKFLYFGSCGSLDKQIAEGRLLVPTSAYRDEGVSYHYAEASDYLDIETAPKLMSIFDDIHIPYNATKTWTTDSFYRETKHNMAQRKKKAAALLKWNVHQLWQQDNSARKKSMNFCMPPTV